MFDFLLQIDGLTSEDLTSEILSYILNKDFYSPYQRLFYNQLFANFKNFDTRQYGFEVVTQENYGSLLGTPDIMIRNNDIAVVIENKFFAPYSGGNQISRYVKLLEKHYSSCSYKAVYLLTIRSRKNHYDTLIKDDLKKNLKYKTTVKIDFLIWEDLLELFKSNDFIIGNLTKYIEKKFLVDLTLNKKQMNILKDKNTAEAIAKVFDIVRLVKGELITGKYTTERVGQSYQYFGFFIKLNNIDVWFGYFLDAWIKGIKGVYSPVCIQVREDWAKSTIPKTKLRNTLIRLNFERDPNAEWLRAIDVALLGSVFDLVNELDNILTELNKL